MDPAGGQIATTLFPDPKTITNKVRHLAIHIYTCTETFYRVSNSVMS